MKKIIALLLTLAMVFALCACGAQSAPAEKAEAPAEAAAPAEEAAAPAEEAAAAWEPKQPITIMNYVAAGGAMDLATRKFVEIASKYTDATFVVDNMTGASGMIAADYVLDQPADGYLIYATTVTYVRYRSGRGRRRKVHQRSYMDRQHHGRPLLHPRSQQQRVHT